MAIQEVTIEKWVYGGDGLGRAGGQVVMVPRVMPGERVRFDIAETRSGFLRGSLAEVLEPASNRQDAPCPHFGACGGCHYQHAPYEFQLAQKVAILREVFRRVAKFDAPENIQVISGPEFGYRNRAQFHLEPGIIGFREAGSRTLHGVDACMLLSPRLQEALSSLREMMGDRRFPKFVQSIELFTNETEVQLNVLDSGRPLARAFFDWCGERIAGLVSGAIRYSAAGFSFRVSHNAFFQVNRFLVDRLVEVALEGAEGNSALDLYAGVGLFSLPLSKRFEAVTAVESGLAASRDLTTNAQGAGASVNVHRMSAEDYLIAHGAAVDFALADPPRTGLGKQVTRQLLQSGPRVLTIVSCDPATLARDLAALAPSYRIASLTMIDLFPQTYHLETIVKCVRSA